MPGPRNRHFSCGWTYARRGLVVQMAPGGMCRESATALLLTLSWSRHRERGRRYGPTAQSCARLRPGLTHMRWTPGSDPGAGAPGPALHRVLSGREQDIRTYRGLLARCCRDLGAMTGQATKYEPSRSWGEVKVRLR
jgi:hypothetical protein